MIPVVIVGGILALLLFLPARLLLRYDSGGLWIQLRFGLVRWRLVPQKQKKKAKKNAEKPAPHSQQKPEKKSADLSTLRVYLPLLRELTQAVRRRLVLRRVDLIIRLAADDPCDLAVQYGQAQAILGSMIPLLERAFRIRKRNIGAACDFTAEETSFFCYLDVAITPVRMLAVMLRYAWKLLKQYQNMKKAVQTT